MTEQSPQLPGIRRDLRTEWLALPAEQRAGAILSAMRAALTPRMTPADHDPGDEDRQ